MNEFKDFETISDTNKSEYIKGFKEGVLCSSVGYIIVAIIALVSTLHC